MRRCGATFDEKWEPLFQGWQVVSPKDPASPLGTAAPTFQSCFQMTVLKTCAFLSGPSEMIQS